MKINDLSPPKGAKKKIKRLGRGNSSGHGGTSTKGHKGQKCRSGARIRRGFEGGQMPLYRRIPKRGFTNIFRKEIEEVNLVQLNVFKKGSIVTPKELFERGLTSDLNKKVKILGCGKPPKEITVQIHFISKGAEEKIKQEDGKVEIIGQEQENS